MAQERPQRNAARWQLKMKCIIYQRQIRRAVRIEKLADIPNLKGVKMVGRYLHYDCDGNFISLQYALYFVNSEKYTVDLPDEEDWEEFHNYLNAEFKAAGINPALVSGTIQGFP